MRCIECKNKFTYKERLKSIYQYRGKIVCGNCKNSFIKKIHYCLIDLCINIIMSIFIIVFILPILIQNLNRLLLILSSTYIIVVTLIHILGLITQNFSQYKLYNKKF